MDTRIAKALAAGTVMALPLLGACGAPSTAPESSTAPVAPAASTTSAAATPSTSAAPVDETANVQAASRTFIKAVFGFDSGQSYIAYRDRLEPLMTKKGFSTFEDADFEKATRSFRSRYGQQARTATKVRGTPKVAELTTDRATVSVTYENRIEQRRDGRWRTVKTSVDDTVKLPMLKQDGRWLVDDLS